MIIEDYKTIFIHIPKNAGTSIKNYFGMGGQKDIEPLKQHDTIYDIKEKIPNKYKSYGKFAIIRNPYDRMVSWFHYLKIKTNPTNFITGEVNEEQFEFKNNVDFQSWLKDPLKYFMYPKEFLNTQCSWIDDTVDILKYENLKNDLENFFKKEIKIPHVNNSNHDDYLAYYDDQCLNLVYEKYKEDFEKFNYKKI